MNEAFSYIKDDISCTANYTKVPNDIFCSGRFSELSVAAKFLILPMLSRLSLSQQNNWKDSSGLIYIIFTHEEAGKHLNCSRSKTGRIFAELENCGFIKRKRRGQGKPDIIYLNEKIFTENTSEELPLPQVSEAEPDIAEDKTDVYKEDICMSQNETSECIKTKHPDVSDKDTNNINNNKNKINKNNLNYPYPSINPYEWIEERKEYTEIVKSNIGYDILTEDYSADIIDEILTAMVNAICTKREFIRISGEDIPAVEVKRRFLQMNMTHIEYICDSLRKNKTPVKNMSAYLLTSIYRASDCISLHYQNIVNYDMNY